MPTPIAGCQPVDHPNASTYINRWFLVSPDLDWMPQLDLSTVEVLMRHGMLVLKAPGMLRIDIPLDVIEDDDSVRMQVKVAQQSVDVVDEGELAAVWFSNVTGQACRLVKVHPDAAIPSFNL